MRYGGGCGRSMVRAAGDYHTLFRRVVRGAQTNPQLFLQNCAKVKFLGFSSGSCPEALMVQGAKFRA